MSKHMPRDPASQPGWLLCNVTAFWREFTRCLAANSEHGIFHGITTCLKIEPMILKRKNGLFTIEWE
jgi:hypothetical protein